MLKSSEESKSTQELSMACDGNDSNIQKLMALGEPLTAVLKRWDF